MEYLCTRMYVIVPCMSCERIRDKYIVSTVEKEK